MPKSYLNQAGLPLGLRNNNPGNVRPGDAWQGSIGVNQGFVVFRDLGYGIRALATDVGNDMRLDGKNTIRKLINEYAPPSENDTTAYINAVVRSTGFGADQALSRDEETLQRLIRAIINHELGSQYAYLVTDQDIDQGVGMVNADLLAYFGITAGQAAGMGLLLFAGLFTWYITTK